MRTAAAYLESLSDGRVTYFDGQRVDDLLGEPAFAQAARVVAAGYDRFYSPEPGARNPLLTAPTSAAGLRERALMFPEIDTALAVTLGSLMTLLTVATRSALPQAYQDRMLAFFEQATVQDARVAECITDAKGSRALRPAKQPDPDAYLRVVGRPPGGVIIRGAKLHITAASLCHELLVMPTKSMSPGEEDYSIACAVPLNAPGVSVINTTYFPRAPDSRHFPVSGVRSIPDGMVIFDDVFVPTDRVFLDGETADAAVFAHSLGLWERAGGMAVMAHDADELVGLAQLIAEANGLERVSHIREKIDEMALYATLLRAGFEASVGHAVVSEDGYYFPSELYTNATKYYGAAHYAVMVRHLHDIAGGGVLTAPTIGDLENPQTSAYVRKYLQATDAVTGEQRMRIFHAIRDLTADAYGGWHAVTNLQSGGGLYAQRLVLRKHYDMARAKELGSRAAGLQS
jgi:4-hydroxybutyryl-CoA dehydratase/vinylacetyl-CoA-Delta-isomerase